MHWNCQSQGSHFSSQGAKPRGMNKWLTRDWQFQCIPRNNCAIVFLHSLLNRQLIHAKIRQLLLWIWSNSRKNSSNWWNFMWIWLTLRKNSSNWRNFWKWHWFFSLGRWHWFLAISKFSLGKKVIAKKMISRKKVFCTKKFIPLVYLVNHVEIWYFKPVSLVRSY